MFFALHFLLNAKIKTILSTLNKNFLLRLWMHSLRVLIIVQRIGDSLNQSNYIKRPIYKFGGDGVNCTLK